MKENQKKLLKFLRKHSPYKISAPNLVKTLLEENIITISISRQAMRKQLLKFQDLGYLKVDYTSTQYPIITTLKKRLK